MGKVYQFPQKKSMKDNQPPIYSENKAIMENAVKVLLETYSDRIDQLSDYIKAIRNLDGSHIKNPKELLEVVKELNGVFASYGITNNFYTFTTLSNKFINYYNDNKMLGVFKENKKEEMRYYEVGEFIQEFEYHQFTFLMHEEIYDLLEKQISDLKITIHVLEKTKI